MSGAEPTELDELTIARAEAERCLSALEARAEVRKQIDALLVQYEALTAEAAAAHAAIFAAGSEHEQE